MSLIATRVKRTTTRRDWIARSITAAWWSPGACGTLGACAVVDGTGADRIVDVASGREATPADVAARMRQADVVLLGERHDNAHHHARRAALLRGLAAPTNVVVEHLPRGAAPQLAAGDGGDALLRALEAAGFDAKGWRWPLHEPLFAAIARSGHVTHGGNVDREVARRIAREGAAAVPGDLRTMLDAAPLTRAAQAELERDLLASHCAHLPAARMPAMAWAQRSRDAAMTAALLAAAEDPGRSATRPAARPVVLLAGNGHVRRDYGVPQLLRTLKTQLRVLSIGFVESDAQAKDGPYDIAWVTSAPRRDDPCSTLQAPATPRG